MTTAIAGIILSMVMGFAIPHGTVDTYVITDLHDQSRIVITDPLIGETVVESYVYDNLTEEWVKVES